jgi:predicted ATPase/DNA-binding XRE family transcriptional regulator
VLAEASFGEWLQRQRKAAGWTQAQLAQQIGCSASALKKIEAEQRRPSEQIVDRLAQILHIPPFERADFLGFARGNRDWAARESVKDRPWHTSQQSPRSNLPAPASSLIGREGDIEVVRDYLLKEEIRLVTLVGPPGIGKTRLSIAAAQKTRFAFSDGVFLISLAPLDHPGLIAPAVVQALGFTEAGPKSAIDRLREGIAEKQMLLIMDNCEHLIEEVASLAPALLLACSRLKLLITSRESLRIPGEWLYIVPTLRVPDENTTMSLEIAAQYPALLLFAERARAVRPDFSLNANNIPVISAICAQLNGLPLAIELIAARVRMMSLKELLAGLDQQLTLYADGMRAQNTRQKTLNDAIGWSFDALSAEEQTIFARLSVFSGGCTLKAAEAIFSRSVREKSVPELIASLLDKSLLQRTSDQQEETRFSMLTVIQQFALDRLRRIDMEAEARDRHLTYFLDLAEQAEPYLMSAKRQIWLERLRRDYDNLRAALAWSQGWEAGLRLVGALRWFWEYAGMVREGRTWAEKAIQECRASDSAARAKALWSAGSMAWLQRDYPKAHLWLEESARIWQALQEQTESKEQEQEIKRGLARTLRKSGNVFYSEKNLEAARSLKLSSINLFREVGTRWDLALDLHILGLILLELKDFDSARTAFNESLSLFQQESDPWGIGIAFMDLGVMALRTNNSIDAETWFKESLTAVGQSHSPWSISRLLALLGTVAAHQGESARAAKLFGASDRLREEMGFSQHTMHQRLIENGNESARQQLGEEDFALLRATGRTMTVEQAIAFALTGNDE